MAAPSIWYIRGLNLHQRLPDEVVQKVRDEGRLERWGHRASISRRRDPAELYLVLSGGVDLLEHERARATKLRSGDLFGEIEVPDARADEAARLQAFDDTMLVALARERFEEVTRPHLGMLQTSVGRLLKRKEVTVPVSPLLFTTPQRRLAKVLLHLAEEYGQLEGDQARVEVPVRARHLADLTGIGNQQAQELLDLLERDQLIEVGGKTLLIPSVTRMHEMSLRP